MDVMLESRRVAWLWKKQEIGFSKLTIACRQWRGGGGWNRGGNCPYNFSQFPTVAWQAFCYCLVFAYHADTAALSKAEVKA